MRKPNRSTEEVNAALDAVKDMKAADELAKLETIELEAFDNATQLIDKLESDIVVDGESIFNPETPVVEGATRRERKTRLVLAVDATVYALTCELPKVPRGLTNEMYLEFKKQPWNAEGLTAQLLASGAYQSAAPKAAELRPLKPVVYQMKLWINEGILAPVATEPANV